MATRPAYSRTQVSTEGAPAKRAARPRVVLIDDNALTTWAIRQALAADYDVVPCTRLPAARAELARGNVAVIICGSPIADEDPAAIGALAESGACPVVALVSDPDRRISPRVKVIEKPFDLAKLADALMALLKPADRAGVGAEPRASMPSVLAPLAERLRARFEQEICPRCVHRTADGGCAMTASGGGGDCPIFEWARQLGELVEGVTSDRLADYLDRIQAIICPGCKQHPDGRCAQRDHLECPLDLYLGLVVPIIEEELKRAPPVPIRRTGR